MFFLLKKITVNRACWHASVSPIIWEDKAERSEIQAHSGKFSETMSQEKRRKIKKGRFITHKQSTRLDLGNASSLSSAGKKNQS